jgi:hypothetical protein
VDDTIPKELERICQKAMAKRAVDRYSTAKDMADDLRHFLAEQTVSQQSALSSRVVSSSSGAPVGQAIATSVASGQSGTPATPTSDTQPLKIVPKGLHSFDAHDADFFLELRKDVCRRLDLRAKRLRQIVAGEGRAVASAYQRCADRLPRIDRGYGNSPAQQSAQALSWPACQPGFNGDASGAPPRAGHSSGQEGIHRSRPV